MTDHTPNRAYAERRRPFKAVPTRDVAAMLDAAGAKSQDFRDFMIIYFVASTGARISELAALNVGHVREPGGLIRDCTSILPFYKGMTRKHANRSTVEQRLYLHTELRGRLKKYISWKKRRGESVAPDAPLFVSRLGKRIGVRSLRNVVYRWRDAAGSSQARPFHGLRHTFGYTMRRFLEASGQDPRKLRPLVRHERWETTQIYENMTVEELAGAVLLFDPLFENRVTPAGMGLDLANLRVS